MRFSKYAKLGAYHWKQYTDNTKYTRHANKVKDWVKEKQVLDVGAGDGLITYLLGAKGIDNEVEGVRLARQKGVDVIVGDAYAMPYKDLSFTSITMIDVLEHFDNPKRALREAHRVLREFLYIATPPKDLVPGKLLDRFHVQEWSPAELKTLVESQGFELVGDIEVVLENKCMYSKFRKI